LLATARAAGLRASTVMIFPPQRIIPAEASCGNEQVLLFCTLMRLLGK
jgi:hypothetical protein